MISFVRRFGSRLIVMVGGEAMQSALHFGINIALLRILSAQEYGVFALAMVMGGLSLTYVRALAGMPANIWIGLSRGRGAARAYDVTFGSVALILAAVISLIVGGALYSWLGVGALTGSAFVGLWALRSYLRVAVFARDKLLPAAVGDVVFTVVGAISITALLWSGAGDPLKGSFAALTLANGLGAAATLIASRRPIRFSLRRRVLRRYTKLWRQLGWSAVSVTMINLQGQGLALVVAVIAGPAAYAPIAAMLVLFTPLRLVDTSVANMIQPEIAYHSSRLERGMIWRQAGVWTLILGCGSLLYGSAIWIILPMYNMPVFSGTSIGLIGALVWAIYATSECRVMPRIILEVVGRFRTIALISGLSAVVGMTIVAAILTVAPPQWSLIGALASELMALAGFWLLLTFSLGSVSRKSPSAKPYEAVN